METATFQLPRRLSNRINELIKYLKSIGYTISEYRSWSSDVDDVFLSITSPQQINMDEAVPDYLEQIAAERINATWRV